MMVEVTHGFGKVGFAVCFEVMVLRVLADKDGELNIGHTGKQFLVP